MTIEKLANELNVLPNYLRNQWCKIIISKQKEGIELYRKGWGKTADFGIKRPEDEEIRWD